MRQIEEAMRSLKEKLENIHRFLPRPKMKRGLLNIGGTILKSLFGTATFVDLRSLHETMDSLQRRQESVTHSLDRQLTYVKDLDESVRNDHQAIIDLSTAIKDFAVKTKESFQEVADKLECNNKLRAYLALIRQLEFALIRLESNLDQTLVALQFVLTQRVPANLLPHPVFRSILVNVTLGLPEHFHLAGGTPEVDMAWYYEVVTTSVIASPGGFWLVLSIPLKDVSAQ
jgi:hypothetical protein